MSDIVKQMVSGAVWGGSGGGGLPAGGVPHQMLVTDAEGNISWAYLTHYGHMKPVPLFSGTFQTYQTTSGVYNYTVSEYYANWITSAFKAGDVVYTSVDGVGRYYAVYQHPLLSKILYWGIDYLDAPLDEKHPIRVDVDTSKFPWTVKMYLLTGGDHEIVIGRVEYIGDKKIDAAYLTRPDFADDEPASPAYIENKTHWGVYDINAGTTFFSVNDVEITATEVSDHTSVSQGTITVNKATIKGIPFDSVSKDNQITTYISGQKSVTSNVYVISEGSKETYAWGNLSLIPNINASMTQKYRDTGENFCIEVNESDDTVTIYAPAGKYSQIYCRNNPLVVKKQLNPGFIPDNSCFLASPNGTRYQLTVDDDGSAALINDADETNAGSFVDSVAREKIEQLMAEDGDDNGITNLVNGSSIGSVRGVSTMSESAGYYTMGQGAFAEGGGTRAVGNYSHAEGGGTLANAMSAHAEGSNTSANGSSAHAEGSSTAANGNGSHAEGNNTVAVGEYSHAEGMYTIANGQATHVQGKYNINDTSEKYAHIVGNGSSNSARSNAHTLDWNGNAWFAGSVYVGGTSQAEGAKLLTEDDLDGIGGGASNLVNGSVSGSVRGVYTMTEGSGYIMGQGAFAEGGGTKASGSFSHAEGSGTTASGYYSHAEGNGTTASKDQAHAEGSYTTASGVNSHAEGSGTTASGNQAHAEGGGTTASGNQAHAEGTATTASGTNSHSEGLYTKAAGDAQHVQGKYNIEDADGRYAHIVGNGENGSARSNAHTLDWNGNAWFAGTVEGTALILLSPTGKRFEVTVSDSGELTTTAL